MKTLLAVLAVLGCLYLFTGFSWAQLYPSQPPLFEPFQQNAYGPGINSDATGRPFYWQGRAEQPGPDVTIQPGINRYGYGQSSDQYGRPITPQLPQEPSSGSRWGFGRGRQGQAQEDER